MREEWKIQEHCDEGNMLVTGVQQSGDGNHISVRAITEMMVEARVK